LACYHIIILGAATIAGFMQPYAHHLMKMPMSRQTMNAPIIEPITIAATSPEVIVLQLEPLTIGYTVVPLLSAVLPYCTQLYIIFGVSLTQLVKFSVPSEFVPLMR